MLFLKDKRYFALIKPLVAFSVLTILILVAVGVPQVQKLTASAVAIGTCQIRAVINDFTYPAIVSTIDTQLVLVALPPAMERRPSSIRISLPQGTNAIRTVWIRNTGGGTLHWTKSNNVDWITGLPRSGTSLTRRPWIATTMRISAVGLAVGTYHGTITFTATGVPSQTTSVTLTVTAPLPPRVGVYLNSASNRSCHDICLGWGYTRCVDVGTDLRGTNNEAWGVEGFIQRQCVRLRVGCHDVMRNLGLHCERVVTNWTRCRCEGHFLW